MSGKPCALVRLGGALVLVGTFAVSFAEDFASFLRAGDSLAAALTELGRRGYHISYSSNVVLPEMHVREEPRATQIEALLREILGPWGLAVLKAGENDFLIVASTERTAEGRDNAISTQREPLPLETIDVTATRYGIASEQPEAATTLSAQDVRRIPHLGDDAMRVLKTLPGVAGRDLSAKMSVRGGRRDEVLMVIDGAEIHNGFHFQDDDDGVLSLVDTNLVKSMDFTTGGMTAEHGDFMSGVVDIQTRRPAVEDPNRHAVGISFISSFARTSRLFAEGRGSWIASARRSYLDLLMEEVQDSEEQVTPEYQDAFTAVRYELSDRTSLAAHVLLGTSNLTVTEKDSNSSEAGEAQTSHIWMTIDHAWSDSVDSSTVLAWATGDRQHDNFDEREGAMIGDVRLNAELNYIDLRQDWSWLAGQEHLIKWGFAASRHDASYEYRLQSLAIDAFDPARIVTHDDALDLDVSGDKLGIYAAYRTRFADALSIELGARWDSYRYENASSYARISPRFNAVYSLGERSEVRAAWGIMHQPHAIDRLDVDDGQTQFYEPESARHFVIGYATKLFDTESLRFDLYRKDYSDLRPRFENTLASVRLIPAAEADRIRLNATRARTQGVELTVRRDTREQWGGWISYGYAQAEDFEDRTWRPRSWEQQHTVSLGIGRSGATWDVNLAGFYHSGSPITPLYLRRAEREGGPPRLWVEQGEFNSGRLEHYLRFDLRASRKVAFENGVLTYYVEVFNLLDRDNPCCIDEFHAYSSSNGPRLEIDYSYGFPRLPSFGFQYEF